MQVRFESRPPPRQHAMRVAPQHGEEKAAAAAAAGRVEFSRRRHVAPVTAAWTSDPEGEEAQAAAAAVHRTRDRGTSRSQQGTGAPDPPAAPDVKPRPWPRAGARPDAELPEALEAQRRSQTPKRPADDATDDLVHSDPESLAPRPRFRPPAAAAAPFLEADEQRVDAARVSSSRRKRSFPSAPLEPP